MKFKEVRFLVLLLWHLFFIQIQKCLSLCEMNDQEDILGRLRQTLNEQGIDSFHILEELVPIEEQMEYFRYFERLRKENAPFVRDEEISILFFAGCLH